MTAKNLKPEDAKALAKEPEVDPEELEFSAHTEVKQIPDEIRASMEEMHSTPKNVVHMNQGKPGVPPQGGGVPGVNSAQLQEVFNKMKLMEVQHQAQLKLVEGTVTEILISMKQKADSINQDILRIKKILDSLHSTNQKK
jgi:hypothetical protein